MSENSKKIIIFLLLLTIGGLFYYNYSNKKNFEEKEIALNAERDKILDDFVRIKFKLNTAISKNTILSEELVKQKQNIEEFEKTFKDLKTTNSKLIKFYKKKIEELNTTSNKLFRINDSIAQRNKILNVENQDLYEQREALTAEQQSLKSSLQKTTTYNDTLIKQNMDLAKKVALGEIINTSNFSVKTYKERRKGKFKESERAGRVDMFKTSFVINENQLAPNKKVKVNIVIKTPTGESLIKKGFFNDFDGNRIAYAEEDVISFNKIAIPSDFVIMRDQNKKLEKGTYVIDFYIDMKKVKSIETVLK